MFVTAAGQRVHINGGQINRAWRLQPNGNHSHFSRRCCCDNDMFSPLQPAVFGTIIRILIMKHARLAQVNAQRRHTHTHIAQSDTHVVLSSLYEPAPLAHTHTQTFLIAVMNKVMVSSAALRRMNDSMTCTVDDECSHAWRGFEYKCARFSKLAASG